MGKRLNLDLFTYSPVGPCKAQYWDLVKVAKSLWPDKELGYMGCDDNSHYFQEWGNPKPFLIPRG